MANVEESGGGREINTEPKHHTLHRFNERMHYIFASNSCMDSSVYDSNRKLSLWKKK